MFGKETASGIKRPAPKIFGHGAGLSCVVRRHAAAPRIERRIHEQSIEDGTDDIFVVVISNFEKKIVPYLMEVFLSQALIPWSMPKMMV
ncbi:MAG: hypothetical protein SV775_04340 [Thermodesulfobacteriota bacterium]|nr:hypothetical protein [Thermodesulfobacteriota bacterium]